MIKAKEKPMKTGMREIKFRGKRDEVEVIDNIYDNPELLKENRND